MAKSYFEEFEKKYNRPRMNDITVGFSGIDPAPKSEETEEAIIQIVQQEVQQELQSFSAMDCGEIL